MRLCDKLGVAVVCLLAAQDSLADQFHYNNVVFGDRAMGLGGAYVGVADDASGVVYNPAGMAFALSNDISGSANALYNKRIVYKNTLGSKPFVENSKGSLAPFFGVLQKLDNIMPGLVMGFGITTLDSELKEQNNVIEGVSTTQLADSDKDGVLEPHTVDVIRMHRAVTSRASTQLYSLGVARRIGQNFALGFSVHVRSIDELVQEYQDNAVGAGGSKTQIIQNLRDKLSAMALEPTIGVQWAFAPRWSFGATIRMSTTLNQKFERASEKTNYGYTDACIVTGTDNQQRAVTGKSCASAIADGSIDTSTTRAVNDAQVPDSGVNLRAVTNTDDKKPLGTLPFEYRAGLAFFASQRLLWTFDLSHHTAAKGGNVSFYKREAVTNLATGLEYYTTPTLPLRLGMFTNNDARPKLRKNNGTVDPSTAGQGDHIDYYGISLFLGWVQPNSQLSFGVVNQVGSGKAQKTGGYEIQDVSASATTFAFSASNNF